MAITYQFNDPAFGKINVIPSTTKLLGGETSLTVTIQILPIKNFGVGTIHFSIEFDDGPGSYFMIANFGYNPRALTKNVAASYTDTVAIPIYRNGTGDPSTIIDNINLRIWGIDSGGYLNWPNSWTYNNNRIQYKYGYEPIQLLNESTFYQLGDSAGLYQGQNQSSYVYPLSRPLITLNRAGIFYDTFTTNHLQVTLEIKNNDDTDYDSFYVYWGNNNFDCPTYITNPTSYKYRIHAIDDIGSEIYIPAEQNEIPQYYTIPILLYTAPQFTDDFSVVRHLVDTAAQPPEDKIDEEGEYAKLIGGVKITEFSGSLARTATLTAKLISTNGIFIDMSTGRQAQLPFQVYTTTVDVAHLGQKVDGYYMFDDAHFYPIYDDWQIYSPGGDGPYSASSTYDFQLTLNDGFTTTTLYYQISSAAGILFIEPWGGIGINGKPVQEGGGDPVVDIYCPVKLHSNIIMLDGRTYDTGWQWPTPSATYFNTGSWIKVRRIGSIVNLVGRLDVKSDINSGSNVKVSGLGTQYCPPNNATTAHPQDYYVQVMAAPTVPGWLIRVTYEGEVLLYNCTGAADHRTISFNMTYFVD